MKSAFAFALIFALSALVHGRDKSNHYQLGIYISANAVADNTSTNTTRCNTDVGSTVCSGGVRFNQVIIYQIQAHDGVWQLETYRQAEDSMARSKLGFEPTHLKSDKANPLDLLENGDKVLFRVEEHRRLLGVETDILIPFADNPNKEAKFIGTFVPAVVPEQAKPPSDNVRAMCDAHKLSPDLEKQLCTQSDGSVRPGPEHVRIEAVPAVPATQAQVPVAPPAMTEQQRVGVVPPVPITQQTTAEYGSIGASSDGDPKLRHDGVTLSRLAEDGAAHQAGLRIGDVILAIDGKYVYTAEQLASEIRHHSPGATIVVHYRRLRLTYDSPVTVSQKIVNEDF
jgi:hypothetical protein